MLEAVTPNMDWEQIKYLFHKVGIVALQESDLEMFCYFHPLLCYVLCLIML